MPFAMAIWALWSAASNAEQSYAARKRIRRHKMLYCRHKHLHASDGPGWTIDVTKYRVWKADLKLTFELTNSWYHFWAPNCYPAHKHTGTNGKGLTIIPYSLHIKRRIQIEVCLVTKYKLPFFCKQKQKQQCNQNFCVCFSVSAVFIMCCH